MGDTALLVMDVQQGVVERFADSAKALLPVLSTAIRSARTAHIPVIHVGVVFRSDAAEISPRNRAFAPLVGTGTMTADDPGSIFHSEVAPHVDDIVVVKKRVSAFSGSDLEMVLRSRGITHLVLGGIATSGVVLSTVRQAADLDFELTVLADGCADADPAVHDMLLAKIFPRQAEVIHTAEWAGRT